MKSFMRGSAAALLFGIAIDIRTTLNWPTRIKAPETVAKLRARAACRERVDVFRTWPPSPIAF